MEGCLECDEVKRAEMLEHLKKRELYIANAHMLSMHELRQLYNDFIVPQPRRQRRERSHFPPATAIESASEIGIDQRTEVDQLSKRIQVVCVCRGKRSCDTEQHTPFSSDRKRIKYDNFK